MGSSKQKSKIVKSLSLTSKKQKLSCSSTLPANISKSNMLNETNSVSELIISNETSFEGRQPAPWGRGEPARLEAHLALECSKVEDHVRQIYLLCVARRDGVTEETQSEILLANTKKQSNKQSSISNYFSQKLDSLSEGHMNSINSSLLKAFVVCDIPFSVIDNPFFIDFLQNLCPNYKPPSIKRENIFYGSNNLTLALDRWTSPNGNSIYSFMILIPMHHKYLYSLSDFSANSHMAEFLVDKIELVLNEIGCSKFSAIVTDNASNMKLARQIIHEKHPKILNLNCVAHCVNLLSKDILNCNQIVNYFKKSHQPNAHLQEAIHNLQISGGGLKKFVDTRWISVYEYVLSVTTSTFLTEFGDDDPIEHSETETEIEQNLESINFLNIENMVNLNHNAFQDNESDSESEGSQISSYEENDEYDNEPMISNNEGQCVFDFDPVDLVTDLVNVWENSDTENIEDMLNTEMCIDDNLDDILDEDGERHIDFDPEVDSENLPIALRKARREIYKS
ncbi:17932_t:CDS:2 [Racocetra persica]|uniref:17932_t:CDS:1 n=1 Tax=Racocetra persica TaxID=160502 RepID=A0ACA9M7A6_9GLOM|nr:17932_t:CDS:2 [Racocetra persica]